ncbi:polymorphic toxin type 44 domain-containing protein [Aequorivita antarctica]|uniref:Uncharacterized protein n=1 Tax=Aequorivita antarctica TaxID=153266 RepID=A0A5C6YYL1_9FLAO|nr:polymorphic toxin type 44 domain-containing protein [Aequorivita antarctica]TXD72716.1 hypothetical protein ESU54_10870 [Aequorivita antarctica]SRX74760.1 hypothetical protein AEQU3_01740 [Aequorivita antarctica]
MKKVFLLLVATILISFSPTKIEASDEAIPDVTSEFNSIAKKTKSTFKDLKNKWKVDREMILNDITKYSKNNNIDKVIAIYYKDFDSYRNVETQIQFLYGYFKTGGKGDLKNTDLKKYNKNGGKVIYNGKEFTVEQLGNINYGIALNAFGYPREGSVCAGGVYQFISDKCLKSSTYSEYKSAIDKCFTSKKGKCFDYAGDSKMIREGYNNF